MRPLFIITFFISCIAFLFSNYIIPVATLKSRTLLTDIVRAQPAFDLKEGVFYDKIDGFAIKVGKKDDNDSTIRDVIVYEQGNNQLQDNFIIAKTGVMRLSANKRFLEFHLKDGWRYQERGNISDPNTEFIRIGFKEYKKQFDLSSFQIIWTPDSANINEKMYSIRQLEVSIDSLSKDLAQTRQRSDADIKRIVQFAGIIDSAKGQKKDGPGTRTTAKKFEEILPDSIENAVNQQVQSLANSLRLNAESASITLREKERILRRHKIEWHRKITLSLACLVLFLIGAPLGSIIRKGGLGTPLIFAIVFFMVFYFSSTTGEKFAKEGTLSPFMGMWMATFILLPLGIFLTYKAMRDSQLFNKEFYHRTTAFIRRMRNRKKFVKEIE